MDSIGVDFNFYKNSYKLLNDKTSNYLGLELSFNQFTGAIPTSLANVSKLAIIELSDNNFRGKIPTNFGSLQNLQYLVMHSNFLGNKEADDMAFLNSLTNCSRLKLKKNKLVDSSTSFPKELFLIVSYRELLKATCAFSLTNLVGVGCFGSVYKGILDQDEKTIAVKVLNLQRQGASRSFMVEYEALRNIRHRNLVKVITSCSSIDFQGNDFKALVYEFMPNGSLERWLISSRDTDNGQDKHHILSLHQRINIAMDVACAL
ncbi:hypothetical protein LguiA_030739 [Lonicera macranthoides]